MKYRLHKSVIIVEPSTLELEGIQLKFSEPIIGFLHRINYHECEGEDKNLLEDLLGAGIIVLKNDEWVPENCLKTFFCAESENLSKDILIKEKSIGIIGLPYYAGTTATIGIDGVDMLRTTSLTVANIEDIVLSTDRPVKDYGDVSIENISIDSMNMMARSIFSSEIKPMFIGGDHTVTYALVQGYLNSCNSKLTVLYFDSHSDLGVLNDRVAHNNVFSWLSQDSRIQLVSYGNFVFMGDHEKNQVAKNSIHIDHSIELIEYLRENSSNLYISFDFDCLSTHAVSYPNANGKNMREIINVLSLIADLPEINLIGADFVEYNSIYDVNNKFEARKANEIIARIIKLLV